MKLLDRMGEISAYNRYWLLQKPTTDQRAENKCELNVQPQVKCLHYTPIPLFKRDHQGRKGRQIVSSKGWQEVGGGDTRDDQCPGYSRTIILTNF